MVRKLILALCLLTFACAPRFSEISTPTLSGIDLELDIAITQARDSLDTFIEKIATPHSDRTIVAVKVRFVLPDSSTQDIWVDQISYQDGSFHGTMGDDIPSLKLNIDDKIKIESKDIVDWMIVEDGKLIGGYTIRLAFQRMSPEQKERFLETVHYSIGD